MLAIVTLTTGGLALAEKIHDTLDSEIFFKPKPFKDEVHRIYKTYDDILFIMATGIVVRTLAPVLGHKSEDPAVVVMDEKGAFAISLLSGHLGGANKLAEDLSQLMGAQPVITTASDVNGLLSVDMLAEKYGYILTDYDGAKDVTSLLVEGNLIQTIGFDVNEKNYSQDEGKAIVYLSHYKKHFDKPSVQLIPKNLVLGIGCKRGTSFEAIESLILEVMKAHHLHIHAVSKIASAWVKSDEIGIIELSKTLDIPFVTYEKEEISKVSSLFDSSEFVEKTIGIGHVSEPCGYLASDMGKCLVNKIKHQGITLSIWEKKTCCT